MSSSFRFAAPAYAGQLPPATSPTFSVLIPTYEAAATVAAAVESALDQTYPAKEIIVVDDGSTDGPERVLAPYRLSITFLRQANRGGAGALNAALRQASGDFVAVLDADDAFLPRRLERLAELARARPDLDILASDAYFERDGEFVGRFNIENGFPVDRQRQAILERCFLFNPALRRTNILGLGGWDESLRSGYDWDGLISLILAGATAGLVEEPLTRYRFNAASLTASRTNSLRDRVTVLEKAASSPHLRDEERPILASSLALHRRRALLSEAYGAIAAGAPEARTRCLAVACGSGFTLPTRARALAVSPRSVVRPTCLGGWWL